MQNDTSLSKDADSYGRNVSPYHNISDKQEKYKADKLYKRLRRKVGHAIGDFGMIEENDKIIVAMSGGKDSYALLDMLLSLKRSAPIPFTLIPVHVDPGFPNAPTHLLEEHLKKSVLNILSTNIRFSICVRKRSQRGNLIVPYAHVCVAVASMVLPVRLALIKSP